MPVLNISQSSLGSVLFGQPNIETVDYFSGVKDRIFQRAGAYKEDFLQTSQQIYDSIYSARALELAKAAINKAGSLFAPDLIKELRTMDEFQTAKPTMQRWVMANPLVRQMFIDRRCHGYGDSYFDLEPGLIGEEHYDYRRVMNGVMQLDKTTNELYRSIYRDHLREGDVDLDPSDQVDILNTFHNVENFMRLAAKDPTNDWNGDL